MAISTRYNIVPRLLICNCTPPDSSKKWNVQLVLASWRRKLIPSVKIEMNIETDEWMFKGLIELVAFSPNLFFHSRALQERVGIRDYEEKAFCSMWIEPNIWNYDNAREIREKRSYINIIYQYSPVEFELRRSKFNSLSSKCSILLIISIRSIQISQFFIHFLTVI